MKMNKCIMSFALAVIILIGMFALTGLTAAAASYNIDEKGNCPASIDIDLKDGNQATIGVTFPSDSPEEDEIVQVQFSVPDPSIATISNTGEIDDSTTVTVTALKTGSTKIICKVWYPGDDFPNEKEITLTVTDTTVAKKYTITYDPNGGTGTAPTESDKESGEKFVVKANTFTPPGGKQFVAWNSKADGTGTSYGPGETVTMPESDLVFYAVWEKIESSSSTPSASSKASSLTSNPPIPKTGSDGIGAFWLVISLGLGAVLLFVSFSVSRRKIYGQMAKK